MTAPIMPFETKNARQVTLASVPTGATKMSPKILRFTAHRRNHDRYAAELRQLRRELAELRKQINAMTPPAPWGLGGQP